MQIEMAVQVFMKFYNIKFYENPSCKSQLVIMCTDGENYC